MGKSSLVLRFVRGEFVSGSLPTVSEILCAQTNTKIKVHFKGFRVSSHAGTEASAVENVGTLFIRQTYVWH